MNEKPLERLNYFNGQRLQAADFKLEQDYHIRVRRWLNRSLYSSGIASGLNVYAIKNQPRVRVTPGLAIDHLGREIILLDEQIVDVVGVHPDGNRKALGPYLTIRYQEDVVAQQDASCLVGGHPSDRLAWKGPARILAGAVLELNPNLPNEESGKIPLACLTLAKGCASVDAADLGVRRYIGASSASKVRQYALEGERHIASNSPGLIQFHIRGRQPAAVILYLRAEEFSKLFYTEVGHHTHGTTSAGFTVPIPQHDHTIPAVEGRVGSTSARGGHTPSYVDIRAWLPPVTTTAKPYGIAVMPTLISLPLGAGGEDRSMKDWLGAHITFNPEPDHWHAIPTRTDLDPARAIPLSGTGGTGPAGVSDVDARDNATTPPQNALTFVDDLQIHFGPDIRHLTRVTDDVLTQLRAAQPAITWDKLGDGRSTHALANQGTGEIKLHYLPGIAFTEGEYIIALKVTSGGGRVHFNLYVE